MIITKEMIDKVRPFAQGHDVSKLEFYKEVILIQEMICVNNLELVFRIGHSANSGTDCIFLYLFDQFAVIIKKGDEYPFAPNVYKDDLSLNDYVEIGMACESIEHAKNGIKMIVDKLQPEIDHFKKLQKVRDLSRWGFVRMEDFFNAYSQDNKSVDTEAILKKEWNKKEQPEFAKGSSGKHSEYKTMRLVIDEFYETFKQIENDPTLKAPVEEKETAE